MLKVWNVVLVIAARSALSLFGTFLTRSGVVNSIHSFTQSSIGALVPRLHRGSSSRRRSPLLFWRLPLLRSRTRLESLVSREATFLYNNLLLVALCLTILWGVAWPILSEAVRGESVVVGRPYYNFFLRVFGLPLLLLMGIGPLVAWRRASLRGLAATFVVARGRRPRSRASCCWRSAPARRSRASSRTRSRPSCSATIVLEFARGTRARRALAGGSWPRRSPRSWRATGGATAATSSTRRSCCSRSAIVGSSAYDTVSEGRLCAGADDAGPATTRSPSARSRRRRLRTRPRPARSLAVRRGGDDLGTIRAGQELLPRRAADLERGRHPQRPGPRRGPVRDRRPGEPRTAPSTSGSSSSRSST